MFEVYWVNFGYAYQLPFASVDTAVAHAVKVCFEAVVMKDGNVVAAWSPLGGRKNY